jgi:hypothetical protein
MCVSKNIHMKNLFLILLCGITVGMKAQEDPQEIVNYSFQINYINFIQSGNYNLQGFRLAYWPREYRTPYYYRASPSLAGQGLYGNSVRRVYPNNNNVGILLDVAFTPPDSVKTNEKQLVSVGIIFPVVDKFMFHLGVGSKWNNGVGENYESDVIATYGLSYVLDRKGLTFTLARQPKRLREMFTRGEASTMIGVGYTFNR